jgi:glycosyltransferase involved in cell wall biosynthesis
MILTKAYYYFKPLIPWSVRMAMRRRLARAARKANADVWPINEKAAAVPSGWPGWPEGKRFAIVLTHDVEGSKGLSRVEDLMKVEQSHGFRSSFNFVPEGEYRVPDALRETLDRAQFEVGIHGLQHDGKLYSSKAHFAATAAGIREYARRWNAAGFRSPFMQHKLSWLHELGLEYDASTFDTDPFEPQPDPVETIFPFWVAGLNGNGYVELPYTLVQDFSLFVILRDRNIDVWKRKLDWVAAHGGMVLLNTHPDYMCFDGNQARDEFPIDYYEELLRYAREKYEGAFWQALPREVARYYCASVPVSARNTRKKICMVAYSSYETDNRVRRYAEALASRGDQVDVIAVAGGEVRLGSEVIKGVTARRIQYRQRNERSKWDYAWRLIRFLVVSSVVVARQHHRKRYDAIHVHNIPDFLVFAAWYPKWTGVKVVLDIHDIVPELYASKFNAEPGDRRIGVLKHIEKKSAGFADHVIVSNDLWYQTLVDRSVPKEKCSVLLNHVDCSIFYRHPRTRNDGKFIVLFPGSFQWHQGLDLAIEAIASLRDRVPNIEFHIYGGGHEEAALVALCSRLGLNDIVKFCGSVTLEQMPGVIANADLGVVPKRANSFGNEAYSTKIMEFMSQGVPVVVSRTKIDTFYYDETVVRFFTSGDSQALAAAMLDVIEHKELRDSLIAAGYEYVNRHGWDVKRNDYLALMDSLTVESFSEFQAPTVVPAMSGQARL